jgi:hypothetical protein
MCLVIDVNAMGAVFDRENADHSNFKTIEEWVISGKAKLIFGGTKYREEIAKLSNRKYVGLFNQLRQMRKIVYADDGLVDTRTLEVGAMESATDFNDQHVVGLISTSAAKVLCTNDNPLIKYAKMSKFYPKHQKPPFIFTRTTRRGLVKDTLISPTCRPCRK